MVELIPQHPKTPSSLASIATLVSPFWYRLTQVVLKRPLNGCSISSSGGRQSWLYVTFWCTLNIPYWTVSCTVIQNSQLQFTGWLCFPQYYTVLQKLHQLQIATTLTNINLFWHTMFRSCTFFCKKTPENCQRCYFYMLSLHWSGNKLPSVLWRCWLVSRKRIRLVKTEWWGAGVVICLDRLVYIAPINSKKVTKRFGRQINEFSEIVWKSPR